MDISIELHGQKYIYALRSHNFCITELIHPWGRCGVFRCLYHRVTITHTLIILGIIKGHPKKIKFCQRAQCHRCRKSRENVQLAYWVQNVHQTDLCSNERSPFDCQSFETSFQKLWHDWKVVRTSADHVSHRQHKTVFTDYFTGRFVLD